MGVFKISDIKKILLAINSKNYKILIFCRRTREREYPGEPKGR